MTAAPRRRAGQVGTVVRRVRVVTRDRAAPQSKVGLQEPVALMARVEVRATVRSDKDVRKGTVAKAAKVGFVLRGALRAPIARTAVSVGRPRAVPALLGEARKAVECLPLVAAPRIGRSQVVAQAPIVRRRAAPIQSLAGPIESVLRRQIVRRLALLLVGRGVRLGASGVVLRLQAVTRAAPEGTAHAQVRATSQNGSSTRAAKRGAKWHAFRCPRMSKPASWTTASAKSS
jgi:hypothetical protein